MNIFSILINGAVLFLLLAVFAKHEADFSFPKALLVMVILAVGGAFLQILLGFLALPIILALMVFLLRQFFYLSWKKASIVTFAYVGVNILIGLIF